MTFPHAYGTATAADLVDLEHHEVVGGEVVEKASPTVRHGVVQGLIQSALSGFVGHDPGEEQPGGWWIGTEITIELEPGEVYQPDLSGWHIERLPELTDDWPMRVVPDWACEVLSRSTAARDLGPKLQAYYRARMGHYWIVDAANHTLTVYRWQEGGYVPVLAAGADDVVRAEPFDVIDFDVGRIFGLPPKKR